MTFPQQKKVVMSAMAVAGIAMAALTLWKYLAFDYRGLDLAIFHQVLWNLVHGHGFASSIHAPSYLGDHASPFLLLLAPLYWLAQSPVTLILIQGVVVCLGAWPLWRLARRLLGDTPTALAIPLLYLANPFVWNVGLYEFGLLAFWLPLGLAAADAYHARRFGWFALWLTLLASTREDAALVVAGFGLLALGDRHRPRRTWWWVVFPFGLAAAWLASALAIIQVANPDGTYKFAIYYGWLGTSVADITLNALRHPVSVLAALVRPKNLLTLVAFLLPLLGLPLAAPLYVSIGLIIVLGLAVSGPGLNTIIYQTQYAAPILLALWAATPFAWHKLRQQRWWQPSLAVLLVSIATLYCFALFGPHPPAHRWPATTRATANELLARIPANASVVTSYAFLPALSGRQHVYALNYSYSGSRQYSSADYEQPFADYLLLDRGELVSYQLQYASLAIYTDRAAQSATHLRDLLIKNNYQLIDQRGNLLLFAARKVTPYQPYSITTTQRPADRFDCQITNHQPPTDTVTCQLQFAAPADPDLQLRLVTKTSAGETELDWLPLADGLLRADELSPTQQVTLWFHLPTLPDGACLQLAIPHGEWQLNSWRSPARTITSATVARESCL